MKKVVFDYGHGGHDSGAIGYGIYEKNVVLELGRMTKKEIEKRYEVKVLESRPSDAFKSLAQRSDFANKNDVDYFVSFHNNAFNGIAEGFETFTWNGLPSGSSTNKMRDEVHAEIMAFLKKYGIKDRGRKKANFHVVRETNMPAMLIEFLFIDNARENKLLKDNSFLRGLAIATAEGIAKAMNLKAKTQPKPTPPKQDSKGGKELHYVQIGAFSSYKNAESLAAKAKAAGFNVYIKPEGKLHLVQIGAFGNRDNAENLATKAKKKGFNVYIRTE